MGFGILLTAYLRWHWGRAIHELWELEKNFLWFGWHFFSIPLLAATLFAPFHRLSEEYKPFDPRAILESFIVNSISRLIGFSLRLALLLAGFLWEGLIAVFFPFALLAWILLPFWLALLVSAGIGLVFF